MSLKDEACSCHGWKGIFTPLSDSPGENSSRRLEIEGLDNMLGRDVCGSKAFFWVRLRVLCTYTYDMKQ